MGEKSTWLSKCLPALALFGLFAVFQALYSGLYFHVGYLGSRAFLWSLFFLPFLATACYLLLLRLLPIYIVLGVLLLDLAVESAVAVHWMYFGSAPTLASLTHSVHEAMVGVASAGGFIPHGLVLLLVAKFFFIGGLAWKIRAKVTWSVAGTAALGMVPLMGFAFLMRHPVDAARPYAYEICAKVHGLYTAVLSEAAFHASFAQSDPYQDQAGPARPLEVALEVPADYRDSIIAIQVESLDWSVLDYQYQGEKAVPFLGGLARQALLVKLNPHHSSFSGSSGADYQFLTSQVPPFHDLAFRNPDLENLPSLPKALAAAGIQTTAMHGNAASFWGRDRGFARLGVQRFVEKKDYPEHAGKWGVADMAFLDFNASLINQAQGRNLFFMITMSSHAPFRFVRDEVFRFSGTPADYLNSIHYADRSLAHFFATLKGRHMVVLYGDHCSNVQGSEYNAKPDGHEWIPGMVFLFDNGAVHSPAKGKLVDHPDYDIRSLAETLKSIAGKP